MLRAFQVKVFMLKVLIQLLFGLLIFKLLNSHLQSQAIEWKLLSIDEFKKQKCITCVAEK